MAREQERAELHRTIWQIANDLRGSVDGWDFKNYVLGMLFYRFISENITAFINAEEHRAGNEDFDYAECSDEQAEFGREVTVQERGFYILPSQLFGNVRKRAAADPNLNETLNNIFHAIENSAKGAASEDDMKGLFADIDVNSNKLGATVQKRNETLVKILDKIGDMKLGNLADSNRHLRRRLRVPDDDVCQQCGEIGWRIFYATGGFRTPCTYYARRQKTGEQSVRSGLRQRFAVVEIRQSARQGECASGILWAGDQYYDLQSLPYQHVPARYQLRKVRYCTG